MVRFSLFGIQIEVQPWFWITLVLFGSLANEPTSAQGLLALLLFVLAGFFSVLVHELGHALTGRAFGAQTAITLHAFGGFAVFPTARFSRWQDILVTAAGPAIQLVLGGIAFLILAHVPIAGPMGRLFVAYLCGISIYWALLNLIPVIPLDGGRLLASFLGPRQIGLSLQISMVAAIVAAGLMFKFMGSLFFPIMLGMMAYQNWQQYQSMRR